MLLLFMIVMVIFSPISFRDPHDVRLFSSHREYASSRPQLLVLTWSSFVHEPESPDLATAARLTFRHCGVVPQPVFVQPVRSSAVTLQEAAQYIGKAQGFA